MSDATWKSRARMLNQECVTPSMDRAAFHARLDSESRTPGLHRALLLRQPDLVAAAPVFVSRVDLDRIGALIRAVESVVQMEVFEREAMRDAPPIARHRFGPRGVFFGYDFHLSEAGPQLIEINTNAGGAFMNLVLAQSQRVCCEVMAQMMLGAARVEQLEEAFLTMFREEWRRQRGEVPLRTIAIVDDYPTEQFLYGEFLLCQAMFHRAGYDARVLAPQTLIEHGGRLFDGETAIDLVYNRLTDFHLEQAGNIALRSAYEAGGVVVTPHPRAHAMYADKRLLELLSDGEWLARNEVPDSTRETLLAGIPRTEVLDATSRTRLWHDRAALFFKPVRGFGSVDVHRGDELSDEMWTAMCDGEFVAQRLVPPGTRTLDVAGEPVLLKVDLRAYAYEGEVQLVAARLYQGQATNLRTVSGGFAPVRVEGELHDTRQFACWEECRGGRTQGDRPVGAGHQTPGKG